MENFLKALRPKQRVPFGFGDDEMYQEPQPDLRKTIRDSAFIALGKEPLKAEYDNPYMKAMMDARAKSMFQDPLDQENKRSLIAARNAGLEMDESGNVIGRKLDTARTERETRMHDFETRKQGGNLRNELNQNSYIKRFREMNSAASGIDTILQDTISRPDNASKNVGDQALITLYNKILDPMSVVRESEYARTPDGQSLMNRIGGYIQKVASGGAGLVDADRLEIARAAKILINNAGDLYNKQLGQTRELAGVYQVPEEMVMSGFESFSPYDVEKQYGNQNPSQQPPNPNQINQVEQRKQALRNKYANK